MRTCNQTNQHPTMLILLVTIFSFGVNAKAAELNESRKNSRTIYGGQQKMTESSAPNSKVVNWNQPPKEDIVERAVSDGVTDPQKIVEFAKNYNVTMTTDEVKELQSKLKSKKSK